MKKIILSLVALLAFGFSNAQETKENVKKIAFGVKAGANYDWLATGGFSVYDLRPAVGYHAGLLAEYKLSDDFSVQTEAVYSFHNINFDGNGSNGDKLELSQIVVPVVGKLHLYKGLSLEAGAQGSMILTAKSGGNDIKDDIRKFNVAAVSGLSYDFGMGIFAQARYVYNFLDFQNGSKGNNLYGMQVSLGYKF